MKSTQVMTPSQMVWINFVLKPLTVQSGNTNLRSRAVFPGSDESISFEKICSEINFRWLSVESENRQIDPILDRRNYFFLSRVTQSHENYRIDYTQLRLCGREKYQSRYRYRFHSQPVVAKISRLIFLNIPNHALCVAKTGYQTD